MTRVRLVASGAFFLGYLGLQIVYPALAWFAPGFDKFTWHMYAGQEEIRRSPPSSRMDRSGRSATRSAAAIQSACFRSVDQRRFLPPYLCAHWEGATRVVVRYPRTGREETLPCPSPAR